MKVLLGNPICAGITHFNLDLLWIAQVMLEKISCPKISLGR